MTQGLYTILRNGPIAPDTFEMTLQGDTSSLCRPGQFINIALEGLYLRRPISVCHYEDGLLTIIYKAVGKGTRQLSEMLPGQTLDVLCGLGNGFDVEGGRGKKAAVIGGGVGVPPMYDTARRLIEMGCDVTAILGFATKDAAFYIDEFKALGARVLVTTDDGSLGIHGFVTDALAQTDCDYFFACGPQPMLRSLHRTGIPGQLSFEERMGCGFGACMGCSCKTKYGNKRICKDGPVLEREEIVWS